MAHFLADSDEVSKISIVSRGMMGGYTRVLPENETNLLPKSQLEKNLAWTLGGHAAEKVVFGEVTMGSSNDIEKATERARMMVTQWGMSDKVGTLTLGKRESMIFLGRDITEQRNYSERVAEIIDEEVRRMVDEAYKKATEVLIEHRDRLDHLATMLIEHETLDGEYLEKVLAGETLPPRKPEPEPEPEKTEPEAEEDGELAGKSSPSPSPSPS